MVDGHLNEENVALKHLGSSMYSVWRSSLFEANKQACQLHANAPWHILIYSNELKICKIFMFFIDLQCRCWIEDWKARQRLLQVVIIWHLPWCFDGQKLCSWSFLGHRFFFWLFCHLWTWRVSHLGKLIWKLLLLNILHRLE